ncbi:hypothetical protein PPERSA_01354 [Pseudocohnilembus persalinus]|uniref:Uncharacterized protein n=1 Tax=Pseudocohnilembus persalinus TaxID=266149 RepID=A0A0V0QGY5_PSEPJ|nr:hypothetical protein PPERSA_01354 [Pseudocohnilembus persalinus]|eukprot:KRX01451.1 hypothetical protein PPERSA_01354 [Pseudocohnilembus persalinus]
MDKSAYPQQAIKAIISSQLQYKTKQNVLQKIFQAQNIQDKRQLAITNIQQQELNPYINQQCQSVECIYDVNLVAKFMVKNLNQFECYFCKQKIQTVEFYKDISLGNVIQEYLK